MPNNRLTNIGKINKTRRIQISKFNGKHMIALREYYESKDGEMLPTKKVRALLWGIGHSGGKERWD